MPYIRALICCISVGLAWCVHANSFNKISPYQAKQQLQQIRHDTMQQFGIVDSPAALQRLAEQTSPLDAFSEPLKQEFIASVAFNSHTVVYFNMPLLSRELTPTEIYRVLVVLGTPEYCAFLAQNARVETSLDIYLVSAAE